MARTANHSAEDTNLLRILKEKADQFGEAEVKKQDIALEYGISNAAITKSMDRLKEKGYIDFEFTNRGRAGSYYRVWMVDQNKTAEAQPTEDTAKLRICKCCGSKALNENARYCWHCGSTLMTEQEQLKEAYDRVLPKIAKLGTDSTEMNEIMTIIGKVANMAFKEVVA